MPPEAVPPWASTTNEIGRAACRERGENSGGAGSLKKKKERRRGWGSRYTEQVKRGGPAADGRVWRSPRQLGDRSHARGGWRARRRVLHNTRHTRAQHV